MRGQDAGASGRGRRPQAGFYEGRSSSRRPRRAGRFGSARSGARRVGRLAARQGAGRARRAGGAETENPIDLRPIGQLAAGQLARDPAPLQHQDPIRKLGDEVEVLLHQQDRQGPGVPELRQRPGHVLDDRGLDPLGGLIEEKESGIAHQAARQRQELLLAAGKRFALAFEQGFEPGEVRQQRRERRSFVVPVVVLPGEFQVLPHRQPREDPPALGHVSHPEPRALVRRQAGDLVPVVPHGPGAGGQEAHQGLQERGLPHAVVAEDPHHLAFAHLDPDAVQDRHPAVPARQILHLQADGVLLRHLTPSCRRSRAGRRAGPSTGRPGGWRALPPFHARLPR